MPALLLAVLLAAPPAAAQDESLPMQPEAREHLERGLARYREGRYQDALAALLRSYDLDPRPETLYSLGQTSRELGSCDRALEYFRAFLRTAPPARQVEATRVQMARCERDRLRATEAPPPAAPPPPPVVVDRAPPPAPPRVRPFVSASLLGELVSRQLGAELAAGVPLGGLVDLGAAAVLGRAPGGRLVVGLHPRRGGLALQPAAELRGAVHAPGGDVVLGGGVWLGGTLEAGPGRVRAGAAVEAYTAHATYHGYAVLAGIGYAADL